MSSRTKIIGLTGSIGMGKSTVATMMKRLGIPVHNADAVVHRLLQPEGSAHLRVKTVFPEIVKDGRIDRVALGNIVFADAKKLAVLESIIHPLVRRETEKFVRRARHRRVKLVALDIPLLFEKKLDRTVDAVMTVTAPYFIQKSRVLARPGMSEAKFRAILARQVPDRVKRARSEIVLATGRHKGFTFRELKSYLKQMSRGGRYGHARNRSRY